MLETVPRLPRTTAPALKRGPRLLSEESGPERGRDLAPRLLLSPPRAPAVNHFSPGLHCAAATSPSCRNAHSQFPMHRTIALCVCVCVCVCAQPELRSWFAVDAGVQCKWPLATCGLPADLLAALCSLISDTTMNFTQLPELFTCTQMSDLHWI